MTGEPLKPRTKRVTLAASTLAELDLPGEYVIVGVIPVTVAATLQVSFQRGKANEAGQFFTLTNGQSPVWDAPPGRVFKDLQISLFSGSAIAVDVVAWA